MKVAALDHVQGWALKDAKVHGVTANNDPRRMPWSEAADYFGHIDAELTRAVVDIDCRTASVALHYWPYWLHPKWQAAVVNGWDWRIQLDHLQQTVVVEAVGLVEAHVVGCTAATEILDAFFVESGRWEQWPYEATCSVMSDQALTPIQIVDVATAVATTLEVSVPQVLEFFPPLDGRTSAWTNFSLGLFPTTVVGALLPELRRRRIAFSTFGPTDATEGARADEAGVPALFRFDDSYLLADAFEVLLPDFHMPDDAVVVR